jgi:sugar lactone lactonase YvrE
VAGGVPSNINALSVGIGMAQGFAKDASGNLYIADYFNSVIYEVDSSGNLKTVAGNGVAGYNRDGIPATRAELQNPESVFVDRGGSIFIADTLNYRIREVVASTGNIQTVAGNGTHVIPCGTGGDGVLATSTTLEI